jgi:hypothetical protein
MINRTIDPVIAEAVISARILKLRTAREAAEYKLGIVDDLKWALIGSVWEWHFSLSTFELRGGLPADDRRGEQGDADPGKDR